MIFKVFLLNLGMAAILVSEPGPFEQTFVHPVPRGYIWNMITIGPGVPEKKSFENFDERLQSLSSL